MNDLGNCPKCGISWDGGSILTTLISHRDAGRGWKGMSDDELRIWMEKRYPPPYRWSRLQGIENSDECTSFWECPDCKTRWDFFTEEECSK